MSVWSDLKRLPETREEAQALWGQLLSRLNKAINPHGLWLIDPDIADRVCPRRGGEEVEGVIVLDDWPAYVALSTDPEPETFFPHIKETLNAYLLRSLLTEQEIVSGLIRYAKGDEAGLDNLYGFHRKLVGHNPRTPPSGCVIAIIDGVQIEAVEGEQR